MANSSLDNGLNNSSCVSEGKEIVDPIFPSVRFETVEKIAITQNSELENMDLDENLVDDSKTVKRDGCSDLNDESALLSNSSFNKITKRHKRNYRSRVMDSSSEDEAEVLSSHSSKAEKMSVCDTNNISRNSAVNNDLAVSDNSDYKLAISNQNVSNSSVDGKTPEDEASISDDPPIDTNATTCVANAAQREESSTTQPAASESTGHQRNRRSLIRALLDSDSEDSLDNEEEEAVEREGTEERTNRRAKLEEKVAENVKVIMETTKPTHKWSNVKELLNREYGRPCSHTAGYLFESSFGDSLHVAQKLELMNKLEYHQGCANALCFDKSGELLASGSDDLQIAVWDWSKIKLKVAYNSGHRNNVFQCKFLPLSGNTHIVSCARDGQVRLAELTPSGVCKDTRRLAKHSRSAHKLAPRINTPYEIMSVGEDAVVYNIDIRLDQPDKVVLVKDTHGSRVPLYSIHSHPLNDDQFCVCGQDEYVRVYDRRIISPFGPPVLKYCPNHLVESKPKSNITCAVYSNNGDAILASYNNEDIYLFDTSLSEGAEYIHRYSGHRNSSTVKGVNFFSPNSKFIVSGSDCGNIFVWDRETEAIVNCMPGDENGVVNVLEPHPHLPLLATSGLDNDVKLWIPSLEREPALSELQRTVRSNIRYRLHETTDDQGLETHMLMLLFQHLRRNPVLSRRRTGGQDGDPVDEGNDDEYGLVDSSDSSSDDNSNDSDSNREERVQCSTH